MKNTIIGLATGVLVGLPLQPIYLGFRYAALHCGPAGSPQCEQNNRAVEHQLVVLAVALVVAALVLWRTRRASTV